jgi:hypothetical protein
MNNAAEKERIFRQKPSVYHLDTRVAVLEAKEETKDESIDNRFRGIENNLDNINKTISQLSREVTTFISAANARHRMWLFIFSLVGAATVILKYFGINI